MKFRNIPVDEEMGINEMLAGSARFNREPQVIVDTANEEEIIIFKSTLQQEIEKFN
ncbi:MAG: hypothetical protein MJA31_07320 [Clostridia bacterium]|nr:hypothetical protein [Clostridia bacterium]